MASIRGLAAVLVIKNSLGMASRVLGGSGSIIRSVALVGVRADDLAALNGNGLDLVSSATNTS